MWPLIWVRGRHLLLAALWAAAGGTAMLPGAAQAERVQLELHPVGSERLAYRGQRDISEQDGRIREETTYFALDGTAIQRQEAVYDRDSLRLALYRLEDLRTGEREELVLTEGSVRLTYREAAGKKEQTGAVAWNDQTVFSATVVPFIRKHWQSLMAGNKVELDLLVASRQESLRFRLAIRSGSAGGGVRVIRMEPESWIIRQLVDPLDFTLGAEPPHPVLEFVGRSTIKTDQGKDQVLRMVYRYPSQP